ncbi:MAG: hypothetical protein KDB00_08350 [Planctomycetales bacterium]|nr:hypothetical protein [Planctomycetales bacterium]
MQTFIGKLTDTVSCTVRISDNPPLRGQAHVLGIEWDGQLDHSIVEPYIQWMNQLQQQMADKWNQTLAYIYQTSPSPSDWLVYQFKPGGTPTKIDLGAML